MAERQKLRSKGIFTVTQLSYVSVEPFHLFRYLDEQAFRFNERGSDDAGRFLTGMVGVVGKRIMYSTLTGKDAVSMLPSAAR